MNSTKAPRVPRLAVMLVGLIVLLLFVLFVITTIVRAVRIVPQPTAIIVERLGATSARSTPGLHLLVPFVDRARANVDLREQVVSFPPQPVITSDNLVSTSTRSSTSR